MERELGNLLFFLALCIEYLPFFLMLPIVTFTIGIVTVGFIDTHFYKTDTNKRLTSSSAATDGTRSTVSTSPNPEQSPGGGTDCPKGNEQGSFLVFLRCQFGPMLILLVLFIEYFPFLYMLKILALAIGFFTLGIIAVHFDNADTNKRLSSSSAATDGMGSTFSASPNPEQSTGGGTDCPKGKEQRRFLVFLGGPFGYLLILLVLFIEYFPLLYTPKILALIIGLFTLGIIAIHFDNTHTNKRLSSSSAATNEMGSTFSTSPNPEQSPGEGTDCPKGKGQGSFHVFLSFRGPDVRQTFLGHLYNSFDNKGIHAYIDDEELQKGEEIHGSLMRAIEDSRIAVVLLSENYASSRWCLDELVKIMERRKEGKLVVKPIFYKVDPREVRTPRKSFANALAVHEAKLGKDSDKVKRWTEALFEVGSLSGWHLDAKEHEAELVKSIIKDVNVLLDRPLLDVAKYPVGMEARVEQIKDLLRLESAEVLLVGLWGMDGVGKTTLAKAVFNAIADQFEGCAFLQNVREESTNPSIGLTKLQEKLLSEVLRRKDVKVSSTAGGISLIKDRLSWKKVLLLLDDLSDSEQLDALAGGLHWFGRGSRILITTKDSSLLTVYNEYVVHKVEELPYEEALQLFSRHAFLESNKTSITKDLVDRCLHYAKGLPLALVVLGSLLRHRPEHHWKIMLRKLKDSPAKGIDKVLRVSFEGLECNDR